MSRSNEELVVLIRNGETDLLPILWEQVENFVAWRARRIDNLLKAVQNRPAYSAHFTGVIEHDDLVNAGYLAMCKAIETYDPGTGAFTTWLGYYLKTAFAEVTEIRTKKGRCDPGKYAISLDKSVGDDADSSAMGELVPDPQATAQMQNVDETLWLNQLHAALEAALSDLPDNQGEILRAKFWDGADRSEIAAGMGITSEKVRSLEGQAIRTLRKPEHACKLVDFYDFSYYSGTGMTTFQHTGASIQERFLLIQEERRERARKRSEAV